jgi:membrane fusion protein (multidrug efflux system)
VVGKINSRQGALVSPSDPQPITTISDVSKVYAYFSLTEKQYIDFFEQYPGKDLKEKLGIIPPIDLVLANGSIYSEKGKIETATGQIDPGTGGIQFRVAYANSTGLLSNGSSGKIKIPRSYGNVLVVPESATFDQQGFTYVFKVINDTARAAVIEIKDRVNNYAIVSKGLEKGDIIIAAGVNTIKPGSAIKPKPANMDSIVNNIKPVF